MNLLLLALVLVGCAPPREQPRATGAPPPNLQGRWWEYPMANPVDIRGDTIKGTFQGKEFTGVISLQGTQLYIVATGNSDLVMVGRYQDYPTVKHFLDDHGLFDMGSDFGDAKESLRVLTLQAGSDARAEFTAADWKRRRSMLKSPANIQWVSPVSQGTGGAAWKQSRWYQPEVEQPSTDKPPSNRG